MADYFLDSSALAKRYVAEPGATWVRELFAPTGRNLIFVVRFTGVEIVAALTRRARVGTLSPAQTNAAIARFEMDFKSDDQLVEVSESVIALAMLLAVTHGLRGYDAVQLASAKAVNVVRLATSLLPIVFGSADNRLNQAAAAEGLMVENPASHT